MESYLSNQLYQVPLAELEPDPTQPRKYMDSAALDEMTASVSQGGIIEPEDRAMLNAAKCTELTYCAVRRCNSGLQIPVEIDFLPTLLIIDRKMVFSGEDRG